MAREGSRTDNKWGQSAAIALLGGMLCGWLLTAAEIRAATGDGDQWRTPENAAEAQRGYGKLISQQYLPPYFSKKVIDGLVSVWDGKDREEAQNASAETLERISYRRYGFLRAPFPNNGAPINFVPGKQGTAKENDWSMSCLACHAGSLMGETIIGLGNNRLDQQTMMMDIIRYSKGIPAGAPVPAETLAAMLPIPFGSAMGTNNGLGLAADMISKRTPDMEVRTQAFDFKNSAPPMDTPAWWTLKKKRKNFYIDGLVAAGPRSLEHALLFPENSGQFVKEAEGDFKAMVQWMDTLQAPRYPLPVDEPLARAGAKAYERACSSCHGTHGPKGHYPEKQVPIDVVGTDRMRLDGMTKQFRDYYATTWLADYGKNKGLEPKGYIAPPLEGVWASAPYFHNGSVPTLWGVLNSRERPSVWRAVRDGNPKESYDLKQVGLALEPGVTTVPPGATESERRRYYDARLDARGGPLVPGQSNVGHTFPDARLSASEKRAVLEYLKTL